MIMTDRESTRATQVSSSSMFIGVLACCPRYVFHAASCRSINHFPSGGLLDPRLSLPFVNFQSKTILLSRLN